MYCQATCKKCGKQHNFHLALPQHSEIRVFDCESGIYIGDGHFRRRKSYKDEYEETARFDYAHNRHGTWTETLIWVHRK